MSKKGRDECSTCYLPNYGTAPVRAMEYDELVKLAIKRVEFMKKLKDATKCKVTYDDLRQISYEYNIPFKKYKTNNEARIHDHYTFYALMSVSVLSEEMIDSFVRDEELLFLYRLRVSRIAIHEISSCFWTDVSLRNSLICNSVISDNYKPRFLLEFEKAFEFFSPKHASMKNGFVCLSTDQVYQLVAKMFRMKLLNRITKQRSSIDRSLVMLQPMSSEFKERLNPKKQPLITLQTLDEKAHQSFPFCMLRIYNVMKISGIVGFKAQFELALFLKGLGLSQEDQTELWQTSGCKNQLNLQAIYGRDGRGRDYTPHSCLAMVTKECKKSVYQVQGCPFRCLAKTELKMSLKKAYPFLNRGDMDSIAQVTPEHPQTACRMLFNTVFSGNPLPEIEIEHPVQYFIEAQNRVNLM